MSWRSPVIWFTIGIVVTFVLAVGVVIVLLRTDGAKVVSDNAPLIAAVIALGGVLTTQMVSIAVEDRLARETSQLEDQRTREARELEAQRAHEAALQNYLEQVGQLLIGQRLRGTSSDDNVRAVLQAQSLAVLEGLDGERKAILLRFLYEQGLITVKDGPVVTLAGADLRKADMMDLDIPLTPPLDLTEVREDMRMRGMRAVLCDQPIPEPAQTLSGVSFRHSKDSTLAIRAA